MDVEEKREVVRNGQDEEGSLNVPCASHVLIEPRFWGQSFHKWPLVKETLRKTSTLRPPVCLGV